ncbi:MAG: DNA-3-methyladenine glycosylase I [Candidatus Thermoplasmatota archaeon]|nr:DNA-3-methyladenine glycosylase I [Candidatus Thermoplasmatota archaeon]
MRDNRILCEWANKSKKMREYHDNEWGRPLLDDTSLFGLFVLETFQAGLSWSLVLEKRAAIRNALFSFNPEKIMSLSEADVISMLENPLIIRNRAKIKSAIQNAKSLNAMHGRGQSFSEIVWSYQPKVHFMPSTINEIPSQTEESRMMSIHLRNLGFTFAGPVTCYSFMQGAGIVNDHISECSIGIEISRITH